MLAVLAVLAAVASSSASLPCPAGCYCDDRESGVRVSCHPTAEGHLVQPWLSLPADTVHLDLAKYGLTEIVEGMFDNVPDLQKLDLQSNAIAHVDGGAFAALSRLQVLDLSRNLIEVVTTETFAGLVALKKLKLQENAIQTVEQGAFADLASLAKLEISENPFVCDCNLSWLVRWLRTEGADALAAALPRTKCAAPPSINDVPLNRLDPEALVCGGQHSDSDVVVGLASPDLALLPGEDQVTFEGDPFNVRCQAEGLLEGDRVRRKVLCQSP